MGRRVILIVEDDDDSREVLAHMVRAWDADVVVATDGVDALRQVARRRPDLILTDLTMPDLDGIELAAELGRHPAWATIPLVAITGRDGPEMVRATLEAGFRAHVVKPVTPEVLQTILHRVWGDAIRRCS
jgi:CheY-like chemotaxis protein